MKPDFATKMIEKHSSLLSQSNTQIQKTDEAIEKLKLEGQYGINFDLHSEFPCFNSEEQPARLTYYGLDELSTQFVDQSQQQINDQEIKLKIQREQEERDRAIVNAKKEMAQLEVYNRFKELQKEYGRKFEYQFQSQELRVNCKICCLSFEGRLDNETFGLFLMNTVPDQLLFITSNPKKIGKTKEFCLKNDIDIKVYQAPILNKMLKENTHINSFKMKTESAMKQVLLDEAFFKYLPLQKLNHGYQVARIKAVVRVGNDPLDHVHLPGDGIQSFFEHDSEPSLFFRDRHDYSLRDLQAFLQQHSFQTILLNGQLNYQDKLHIYFDGQLRLTGNLCKEYFQIRRLMYQHYGKL